MFKLKTRTIFALAITFFISSSFLTNAQVGSSPYSAKGIGEINQAGLINNIGMGGAGLGYGSTWYINTLNPAMLSHNALSTFEVGLSTEIKNSNDGTTRAQSITGNINYLSFAFPLYANKWSMAVGMSPYSSVNYDLIGAQELGPDGASVTYTYSGNGGINQYYLSNGFRIYKGLSAGIKASLLYGSVSRDNNAILSRYEVVEEVEVTAVNTTGMIERTTYSDLGISLGLAYRQKINDNHAITFAATYDLQGNMNAKLYKELETRNYQGTGQVLYPVDTVTKNIIANNVAGKTVIPAKLGLGLTWSWKNKLFISSDVHLQDWSQFENTEGSNENLQNSLLWATGAEFTPNSTSVRRYLDRVSYRAGFSYERSPFYYNGTQVNEFGINFGASFPIGRLSNLNMGANIGQRGTTNNGLIQENFYKIYLGITFNDKWFNRRQFD